MLGDRWLSRTGDSESMQMGVGVQSSSGEDSFRSTFLYAEVVCSTTQHKYRGLSRKSRGGREVEDNVSRPYRHCGRASHGIPCFLGSC